MGRSGSEQKAKFEALALAERDSEPWLVCLFRCRSACGRWHYRAIRLVSSRGCHMAKHAPPFRNEAHRESFGIEAS